MNVRSLLAVALAALLAPLAASAQTRGSRATSTRAAAPADAFSLGGWIGGEFGDVDGIQLRADGELPFQNLAPNLGLSLVGSLGLTFAGDSAPGVDLNVTRFKIVPTARFTFTGVPRWSFFGDAGLGLHYTSVEWDYDSAFLDNDDSEVGLMLRLGAGAFFQVAPKVRLGGQLVIDPMFGDYDDTTTALLVGAMFTL